MTTIIDLQIACQNAENIPTQAQFQQWVELVLQNQQRSGELTIRIVEATESQNLNYQYRQKNQPTNILSFPFEAELIDTPVPLLGDLIICAALVSQQAQEQNKPIYDHWAHLTFHGTLHLLGFDHVEAEQAQQMEAIEIRLLSMLGIDNPYESKTT